MPALGEYWIGGLLGLLAGGIVGCRRGGWDGPVFPHAVTLGFLAGIALAQGSVHGIGRAEVILGGETPILLGYLALAALLVEGGWWITRGLAPRPRVWWRSGVLAAAFAPGLVAFGHGAVVVPALLAALFLLAVVPWQLAPAAGLRALALFAFAPMLATWMLLLVVRTRVGRRGSRS